MRALRRLMPILGLAAAAVTAGCSEFHYYDITVTFNQNPSTGGYAANETTRIQVAVFSVSGADSGSFRIGPNTQGLPLSPGFSNLGVVEFSTFADSGTLNFKVEAYDSNVTTADCKVGEGTMSLPASGSTTNMGTLTVNKAGDFSLCQ
jgi:hypothetical protein